MKVSILAIGSTGDVRPCVMLSKELIKRGHEVIIVTYDRFESFVKSVGADFAEFPGDIDEVMHIAANPNVGPFELMKKMRDYMGDLKDDIERVLLDSFEGSDIVVYANSVSSMAVYIAERLKIPYVRLNYYPDLESSDVTPPVYPKLPMPKFLKSFYNRMANKISYHLAINICRKPLKSWVTKYDLPKTKYFYTRGDGKPMDHLMAYSETICPRSKEYGENVHICGYLFEDKADVDYTPNDELKDFLSAGEPPVYIGFGSMIDGSFEELRKLIINALEISGKRAIISKGWGGFSEENLPDNIYMVDYCPHDWLFEQVSAVVHHGGAGTTAAGLRAGKPTVIIPFGADQTFWGDQINKLGCGPKPIKRKKLNAKKLAKALIETDSPEMQQRARDIADKLAQEDGVKNACDVAEKIAAEGWKL